MFDQRKLNEIEHGARIVDRAEIFWGHGKKAGRERILRKVGLMIKTGEINEKSRILELGCGTGEFTKELAKTGAEIKALDISPDLVAIAVKKLTGYSNVKFVIGDAEELFDLPDNFFTNIIGNSILHHLDYKRSLAFCRQKLVSNGSIFFSEPNMMNPQIALQKNIFFLKRWVGDSPDETAFFRWKLKKDLEVLGFKNIIVKNFDFMHPLLPDFLVGVLNRTMRVLEYVPLLKEFSGSLLIYAEK
ncbi:MAG: class I SAM-dependent methyltransferase [Parcubacteria group bacterium]|nr:class I SAM-dependent methyltransferase [Parcubacteria group bacterium]